MIKLIKTSFYKEKETKRKLIKFIASADKLSMGEECLKFEKKFALKQKRKYAVAVSSGSMANLVLIQSLINLGLLKKGDKVGFSALTWATNVMPLIQLCLDPIALDCEKSNLNISSKILEEAYKKNKFKVLFITNALGFCADLWTILKFCVKHNILLLEDNCEALGSELGGRLLGNFGTASTFSFFAGHHLSTIEGGMICTDVKPIYEMLVRTRAHGWDRASKSKSFYDAYTFYDLAYNAKPTDIQGFIGQIQVDYWDEIVQRREDNFNKFMSATMANLDIIPLKVRHMNKISNFAFPLVFNTKCEKYKRLFLKNQIEIRPIIAGNIENQPFYKKYVKKRGCPNAEFIHENGFYFGNNPEMTTEEIKILSNLCEG